jgi:hypothetical protein
VVAVVVPPLVTRFTGGIKLDSMIICLLAEGAYPIKKVDVIIGNELFVGSAWGTQSKEIFVCVVHVLLVDCFTLFLKLYRLAEALLGYFPLK